MRGRPASWVSESSSGRSRSCCRRASLRCSPSWMACSKTRTALALTSRAAERRYTAAHSFQRLGIFSRKISDGSVVAERKGFVSAGDAGAELARVATRVLGDGSAHQLRLAAVKDGGSQTDLFLSLIHISEPTRLGMISYA